jgi:hypothetical protein
MLTAWLNRVAPAPAGDPTTLAQGPTGWQIPGGADVSGDAANEIAMRWVAVQVSAVSVGADVILGGSAPVTIKTTRRPTSTA